MGKRKGNALPVCHYPTKLGHLINTYLVSIKISSLLVASVSEGCVCSGKSEFFVVLL